jgi:hypothetical protein
MIAQKDVTQPLFTAYLGSWRDSDEADKGEVCIDVLGHDDRR